MKIKCMYCKVPIEALEEENEDKWGPDWRLVDPDELEYYCTSCELQDFGWAMKAKGTNPDE
jgi:hypothetical protein